MIASHLVTNDEFAAFVKATGLITLAEVDGWSFVFAGVLPDDFCETRGVVARSGGGLSRAPTGSARLARKAISKVWALIRSYM